MAQVEEIPEVITCAPTQAEASEMIREALGEWLALLKTGKALDAPDGQRETLRLLVS